jgi:3-dehydroquinate synthase
LNDVELTVRHRLGSYPVEFVPLAKAMARIEGPAFVVTDENVFAAWGHHIPQGWPVKNLAPGEEAKSLAMHGLILEWLADGKARRDSTVVAFGGGVVGDLAGFAAASYMRGVPLIQIPTSLLAQVDSSVGGKVGIDLPQGKNLAGAFYPPKAVYVPVEVLSTLPPRQFVNGMAEIWKYAFVLDPSLADEIVGLGRDSEEGPLKTVIGRCIRLKAAVVEEDEMDVSGRRAVLNFGHTVGHAIEVVTGYGPVLHGEAVSIGMVAEAVLGERLGVTDLGSAALVRASLRSAGLPIEFDFPGNLGGLMAAMSLDKKAGESGLGFSLLTRLGECKLVENVAPTEVEAALKCL